MKQTMYSTPRCEVCKSRLRASILAGSQVVKGSDYEGWNDARMRVSEGSGRANASGNLWADASEF